MARKKNLLKNLKGPKYIIEIHEHEHDREGDGNYITEWFVGIGEYLDYTCDCNNCSTFGYGPTYPTFHEAIRAGIKALDEQVGEGTPFELNIARNDMVKLV